MRAAVAMLISALFLGGCASANVQPPDTPKSIPEEPRPDRGQEASLVAGPGWLLLTNTDPVCGERRCYALDDGGAVVLETQTETGRLLQRWNVGRAKADTLEVSPTGRFICLYSTGRRVAIIDRMLVVVTLEQDLPHRSSEDPPTCRAE